MHNHHKQAAVADFWGESFGESAVTKRLEQKLFHGRKLQSSNTTFVRNPGATKQRLDVDGAGYAKGLSPAGVKSTLSRQYTANLVANASIYSYFEPDKEKGGDVARNLYFRDSPMNTVPGATNCFMDFYQTNAFKSACNVPDTATVFRVRILLFTPAPVACTGRPNPPTQFAFSWTDALCDASGNTLVHFGNSNIFKDIFRVGLTKGLNLAAAGEESLSGVYADLQETSFSIKQVYYAGIK